MAAENSLAATSLAVNLPSTNYERGIASQSATYGTGRDPIRTLMHRTLWIALIMTPGLSAELPAEDAKEWNAPKDVEFRSKVDGSVQRYVEMLPLPFDREQEHHLLIVLHGHGSDRWQYVKQGRGECAGARDVALKHGLIFVSPDYRAPDSWMGPAAEADLLQVIKDVERRHRIGKVILGGGSMGGTGVLIFTALNPDLVHGVVSQNGTANMIEFENFQDSIRKSYGGDKVEKAEEFRKRSPEFFPQKFTMPVAFTTGGKDKSVPPPSVLRLSKALRKSNPSTLHIHHEQGGHATNYHDTVRAYEFVIKHALAQQGKEGVPTN